MRLRFSCARLCRRAIDPVLPALYPLVWLQSHPLVPNPALVTNGGVLLPCDILLHSSGEQFFFSLLLSVSWKLSSRAHDKYRSLNNAVDWMRRWERERKREPCLLITFFFLVVAQEQNFGDQFLHVYLQDGNPVAKLGCDESQALSAALEQNINNDRWISITVRYDRYHSTKSRKSSCSVRYTTDKVERAGKKIARRILFRNLLTAAQINNKSPFNVKVDAQEPSGESQLCILTLSCRKTLVFLFYNFVAVANKFHQGHISFSKKKKCSEISSGIQLHFYLFGLFFFF